MTRDIHGFKTMDGSELPRFLGEFFQRIFNHDGTLLPCPCTDSISIIRDVCYLFYKYKLPYSYEQEQEVLSSFEKTETELSQWSKRFAEMRDAIDLYCSKHRRDPSKDHKTSLEIVREARIVLSNLFSSFDPLNIVPSHGPGVVSTKERLWEKFLWTNVAEKITNVYPFDAYFCASQGHVCDDHQSFSKIGGIENSAQVLLVPKDSRGPRLISCEPVDFQWVQQGLGRAIVEHVENASIARYNVFFTDQGPNQRGALLGSSTGRYSTLDLNEASDRVHLDLVRLLFPERIFTYLDACRSSSTTLPNGKVLRLQKFAPMGSSLCFPILALTVWAILTAAASDADTRESILVYGDDVIVPTAFAGEAIEQLESFGLKINRDKSCTAGLFRESCGVDAYNGVNVTPVRLRTVWSSSRSPDVYCAWISYANHAHSKHYYNVYETIVQRLHSVYGEIPSLDMRLACPALVEVASDKRPKRRRVNSNLQKLEYLVWDVKSPSKSKRINGWSMLLRYFTEGHRPALYTFDGLDRGPIAALCDDRAFDVSVYTSRHTSMLVRRWR
jgi:hypothetical protein